jgi:hypothetical protein
MLTFDGVFFITITTLITGFLGIAIKYCLKSKCEKCDICWGLLTIIRRVDIESQIEINQNNNEVETKKDDLTI